MGIIIVALIIINIFTVYKFIFKFIFTDLDDFNESLRYSFTPDIISLFRREYWKDQFGEFKLGFFIAICIIVTIVEYGIVNVIIQQILRLI
ncbi:hypothetical protein KQI38_16130 [Tissierella carlieri]|jgi:hypothetical protein|uniref:hypothetical protein n=1 Tax=Tissierella TaxID=41273 RepID=UPI001C11DBC3|nr:hypothetical protein [Tissierella carlieri]MBU5313552.1 hypothetical protein [Tissierella carlieri]MDU5083083.1 hypothetical protein [Bacillota bacterium]